ncbi:hypothetical protein BDW69DRAFT_64882 [Aspergillus filifer]
MGQPGKFTRFRDDCFRLPILLLQSGLLRILRGYRLPRTRACKCAVSVKNNDTRPRDSSAFESGFRRSEVPDSVSSPPGIVLYLLWQVFDLLPKQTLPPYRNTPHEEKLGVGVPRTWS